MGKKKTTESALKKSSKIILNNNNSEFAVHRLFKNLRESKSDNSVVDQVPQCVFLGALYLKPVPEIFQVTLQPISSIQQPNNNIILYHNNDRRNINNRGKKNNSRKVKNNIEVCQKSATKCLQPTTINNNFIRNLSDKIFENKILKLFDEVKQSIQEEIVDITKVKEKLNKETKGKKNSENNIEVVETFRKSKIDFCEKSNINYSKIEISENNFPDTKSISDLNITMSSKKIKDYKNFTDKGPHIMKQSNKLNPTNQHNSTEKDIAVENVIRRLRQKKSIEVKKVNDMDSKLKRITPILDKKSKPESFNQSKSIVINLDSYQTSNASKQKIYSEENEAVAKPAGFLELEDDEIEDYLEIDQNVVEDLEALIPEEEIVSISNSLIQPTEHINSLEETSPTLESKPENTEILVEPSSKQILICDSDKNKDVIPESAPQETELEMKNEEKIENKVELQDDEDLVIISPESEFGTNSEDSQKSIMINNNQSPSAITQFKTDAENVGTSKRKSDGDIYEPKKKKISPKVNKVQCKKKDSRKSNKLKLDSDASKNLRKITDFFVPDCKTISSEEQKPQIDEAVPAKSSNSENTTVRIETSEATSSEETEIPFKIRTLRSRSKLPHKTLIEPKSKELQSKHETRTVQNNNKEQILNLEHLSPSPDVQMKIKDTNNKKSKVTENNESQDICTERLCNEFPALEVAEVSKGSSVQNTDDTQVKNEIFEDESSAAEPAQNTEGEKKLKLKLSKNTVKETDGHKRQQSTRNKRGIDNVNKEKNSTQENENKVIEIVDLNPNGKDKISETDQTKETSSAKTNCEAEIKYERRDSNENHVFTGSSNGKEQTIETEIRKSTTKNEKMISVESTEVSSQNEQTAVIKTTESSSEIEHITVETTKDSSVKQQNTTVTTKEKEKVATINTEESVNEQTTAFKITQAQKKRKSTIVRRKTTKNQGEPNIQTNDSQKTKEGTRNGRTLSSRKIKGIQNKNGKSKQQKRKELAKTSKSPDNNQANGVEKNHETKLEIYDFDDKSNDEVEVLKKSTKKRKYPTSREDEVDISPKKVSNFYDRGVGKDQNPQTPPKKQIEPVNVNNNTPDSPGSIATNTPIAELKSPKDSRSEDNANHQNENMSVDSNNTSTSKSSPESQKETEENGQDWKPLYGPYKRIDRCNVCLVAFKSYKKLRAHKKIHEVENPYKCQECDDCFEDVEKLAAHLRIHKGYEDDDLDKLHLEIDIHDVKPIAFNNKMKCYSRRRNLPVSNEVCDQTSSTPQKLVEKPIGGRTTRSSQKHMKNNDIQIKIAEVKKKLCSTIMKEAKEKQIGVKRKSTRSKLRIELKKEFIDESEESILVDYEIPVEDQEEYSQIQEEYSQVQEEYSRIQEEYSQIDDEASSLPLNDVIEIGNSPNMSDIEHIENESEAENPERITDTASLGMMNEMAEAEYLLEQDTNVSPEAKTRPRRGKNEKSTTKKSDIIKVKRDNLPPLILKSVKKKTLLLGKMPYPCKKCDATFWTSFQLERHQLVHVLKKVPPPSKPPSKVFKCEECGKIFKKICDLERHTRVHTGEKPSVCNICNKRFQQPYNLNKHLYTHTQEKNFECVICQKKFGRNDVLNRHVLTHSIVKPFRCSVCARTFIRNSQLKLHLRKHHNLDEDPGNSIIDDPVASTSANK